jgi:exosortase
VVVAFFYRLIDGFGPDQSLSPLLWLESAWNPETDFEHGFLVPLITVGLLAWRWPQLREAAAVGAGRSAVLGLLVALVGAGFFVLAHRSGQARLAVGGLPMVLWGSAWYLYGWQVAKLALFPLFVFWLAIPVPQFQQATTQLQILSTKLAQIGCGWFGVETEVRGTQIFSFSDRWEPLEIDEGCGGIRSLMALILISTVWAYIARMSLWKKALLCVAAIPLAIVGNMLRLTSIFVIAEYGDPEFARDTWHDWSGLIVFYPISLILLLTLHSLLEGGLTKFRRPRMNRREVGKSTA